MLLEVDGLRVRLEVSFFEKSGGHVLHAYLAHRDIELHRTLEQELRFYFAVMDNADPDEADETEIRLLDVTPLGLIDQLRRLGHHVTDVVESPVAA